MLNKKNHKILFMGTPEFAVASLEALHEAGFNIAAVVTAPDKPAGRGLKTTASAVKIAAQRLGLTIWQPERLKSPDFLRLIHELQPDLGIVVAFRMLPEAVWKAPRLGTFNLHASLLPKYRGAAPIQWAIANGETETGVTTFFLKHEIDTGNILFQEKETIGPEDTGGSLYQRLMLKGARLVVKTAEAILSGNYHEVPQMEDSNLPLAPKITREHCLIDFHQSATHVHNLVRAFNPTPGAYCYLNDKVLKIWKTKILPVTADNILSPGEILTTRDGRMIAGTGNGNLLIEVLQLEGKKAMSAEDFLRGLKNESHLYLKGRN